VSILLHISDTHFGTEQPRVVEALVRMAVGLTPDVVVLSGDITQRARRAQFVAARRFVDRLPAPTVALPGNHDIPLFNLWARVLDPYGNYARAFGDDLEPEIELDDMLVVTVRTTRRYRHKHGEVSAEQTERVAERLRRSGADRLRVVVTHQPVHVLDTGDDDNLLRGRAAAVAAWSSAGADLVLGGHIHVPFAVPLSQAYPGLPRELWIAQAGTAVSSRVRREAPNSVNVIRFDAATSQTGFAIERWDFQPAPAQGYQDAFIVASRVEANRTGFAGAPDRPEPVTDR
jgi:3',5'-cyclic AMP phosphodiesterase CpdA